MTFLSINQLKRRHFASMLCDCYLLHAIFTKFVDCLSLPIFL